MNGARNERDGGPVREAPLRTSLSLSIYLSIYLSVYLRTSRSFAPTPVWSASHRASIARLRERSGVSPVRPRTPSSSNLPSSCSSCICRPISAFSTEAGGSPPASRLRKRSSIESSCTPTLSKSPSVAAVRVVGVRTSRSPPPAPGGRWLAAHVAPNGGPLAQFEQRLPIEPNVS